MPCPAKHCRVMKARWIILCDEREVPGRQFSIARRARPGGFCKTHARQEAEKLNFLDKMEAKKLNFLEGNL